MRMHCLAAHKLQRGGRESRTFHVPGRCLQEGACAQRGARDGIRGGRRQRLSMEEARSGGASGCQGHRMVSGALGCNGLSGTTPDFPTRTGHPCNAPRVVSRRPSRKASRPKRSMPWCCLSTPPSNTDAHCSATTVNLRRGLQVWGVVGWWVGTHQRRMHGSCPEAAALLVSAHRVLHAASPVLPGMTRT